MCEASKMEIKKAQQDNTVDQQQVMPEEQEGGSSSVSSSSSSSGDEQQSQTQSPATSPKRKKKTTTTKKRFGSRQLPEGSLSQDHFLSPVSDKRPSLQILSHRLKNAGESLLSPFSGAGKDKLSFGGLGDLLTSPLALASSSQKPKQPVIMGFPELDDDEEKKEEETGPMERDEWKNREIVDLQE